MKRGSHGPPRGEGSRPNSKKARRALTRNPFRRTILFCSDSLTRGLEFVNRAGVGVFRGNYVTKRGTGRGLGPQEFVQRPASSEEPWQVRVQEGTRVFLLTYGGWDPLKGIPPQMLEEIRSLPVTPEEFTDIWVLGGVNSFRDEVVSEDPEATDRLLGKVADELVLGIRKLAKEAPHARVAFLGSGRLSHDRVHRNCSLDKQREGNRASKLLVSLVQERLTQWEEEHGEGEAEARGLSWTRCWDLFSRWADNMTHDAYGHPTVHGYASMVRRLTVGPGRGALSVRQWDCMY